jgi:hypothetical protein
VAAEARQLRPVLAAVCRPEEGGVLDAGVDDVGIRPAGLQVPDALERPGMGCPVVPEVGVVVALIGEPIAHRLPCAAAVAGSLHHLAEPAAALRGVEAVWIGRRALEVVDLPAREVWPADPPALARPIGGEDEPALSCPDQHANLAHARILLVALVASGWSHPIPA